MSGSVPARIVPPERALSPLRLLRTVVDNPIKAWPRAIYRERIVRSRVLGRDTVYVMGPDLIRQMLTDETDNFEKGEIARRGLGPVLGDAILTADGSRWRWQRHAAASIFRQERIRSFLPAMVAAAERRALGFLSSWRRDRRRARNDADNVRHYSQYHAVRAEQHRL